MRPGERVGGGVFCSSPCFILSSLLLLICSSPCFIPSSLLLLFSLLLGARSTVPGLSVPSVYPSKQDWSGTRTRHPGDRRVPTQDTLLDTIRFTDGFLPSLNLRWVRWDGVLVTCVFMYSPKRDLKCVFNGPIQVEKSPSLCLS